MKHFDLATFCLGLTSLSLAAANPIIPTR